MDSSCKLYIGIEPIEHIVLNLHNYMALRYNLRNKTFVEMLILEISNIYNWKPLHIDSSMICSDLNGEECDAPGSRRPDPRLRLMWGKCAPALSHAAEELSLTSRALVTRRGSSLHAPLLPRCSLKSGHTPFLPTTKMGNYQS